MNQCRNTQRKPDDVLDAIVRISRLTDSQERAINEYGMAMLPTYRILARQACRRHQLNPAWCVTPLIAIIADCDRRLVELAVTSPEMLESLEAWIPWLREQSAPTVAAYAHSRVLPADPRPYWDIDRRRRRMARAQQSAALRGSELSASAGLRLQPIALDDVAREAGHG